MLFVVNGLARKHAVTVLWEPPNVEPKVSSPPRHTIQAVSAAHGKQILLTAKYTRAIRCLCFISYETPRGIKLSKSVSVGNGCKCEAAGNSSKKSNEIMCEGTMKEASQGIINVTKCTWWTSYSILVAEANKVHLIIWLLTSDFHSAL